jgi:CRISPR-associated protein Cas6
MTEAIREEIVDLAFRLPGGQLPIDHAYALFGEISKALPWFADETAARLHLVHTAGPGSGWIPPDESLGEKLHLSRRTKLTLRIPKRRTEDAMALSGREMDISGYPLTPGAAKVVPLAPASTLLARHVVCEGNEHESRLVPRLTQTLRKHGVTGVTLICGRGHRIVTPESVIHTRSLVVTNLDPDGAMFLMRNSIGPAGKLGCGIFIPYKRIQ